MLEKYLKFIKGGKESGETTEKAAQAGSSETALSNAVPLLDPAALVEDTPIIDTLAIDADNVVASVPRIETNGHRTNAEKLRQKIVGRQPVLDRTQRIIGYELMLRSKALPKVKEPDPALQKMQDEALLRCLIGLNIGGLLDDKLAFVTISPLTLDNPLLKQLPNNGMVIAVRPRQEQLEANLVRCRELRALGYQIALDDYAPKQNLGAFLSVASFVRMDVNNFDAIDLGRLVERFLEQSRLQLMVKNVSTEDDFEACYKMGFHRFEGNYFTSLRPAMPPRIDSDRIRVLELLNMSKNQDEISKLERVFKHDAVLSYKLLRYINAPINGFPQKIRSIAHALVILGYNQLYRWLTLLLFTSGTVDPRSKALLQSALVRARLMELLGEHKLPPSEREGLFIVGIFSLLDALLNVPMAQALEHLKLPEPVMAALVRREGIYAPFLSMVVACEEADQENIERCAADIGLDADEVNIAQVKALVWAEELDQ